MAEQNYIGIAMGLDVTSLKAGLNEANKQIQLANSEFKSATSGMDDWTKSTEGLTEKVKQLDTVLGLQKSKLSGLKAEYDKLVASGKENTEEARRLKVQLNNQQAIVNKTQNEFDNYSKTLKDAKDGTIDLEKVTLRGGKAVSKMGDEAVESGKDLSALKGIAGGVVGAIASIGAAVIGAVGGFLSLAESTREAREDMAKLTSAFEGASLSSESAQSTFTDLYKVIGETDTAVEAAQQIALLAESEEQAAKWAELATGVTATFGDALKPETFYEAANETIKLGEATGAFTQMLEGTGVNVEDFNTKLASLNTEEEKHAYMLEVSQNAMGAAGKAYEETAGSIMEAREAEAQLSLVMQELGAIAEPIMTELKLLTVDLLEVIKPFVELIGEGLTAALNGSSEGAKLLAEGIGGILNVLIENLTNMLPTILNVVTELLPLIIQSLLDMLPTLIDTVINSFILILNALTEMLPTLIPVIIDAVLLIVDTLLDNLDQLIDAGIELILALADGLIDALPDLIDKIPIIIEKLLNAISKNLPKLVEAGIELIVKLAGGVIKAIPQLVKKIPEIIDSFVNGFKDYYSNMGDVGLNLLKGIWQGIKDGASWLKDKITGFAGNVADWFKDTFKINSPSKLMEDEIGIYLGQGIGEGLLNSLPQVKKDLSKFSNFVTGNLGNIKSGLYLDNNYSNIGTNQAKGNTIVNAGMTVNYNGKLSRKELKRIENDNYNAIKLKLRTEGAI